MLEVCIDKINTLYHSSLFAGHQGVVKTYLTIGNKFFIPNLIHYLHSYIKGCHIYQLMCNKKLPTRQLQTRINLFIIFYWHLYLYAHVIDGAST